MIQVIRGNVGEDSDTGSKCVYGGQLKAGNLRNYPLNLRAQMLNLVKEWRADIATNDSLLIEHLP